MKDGDIKELLILFPFCCLGFLWLNTSMNLNIPFWVGGLLFLGGYLLYINRDNIHLRPNSSIQNNEGSFKKISNIKKVTTDSDGNTKYLDIYEGFFEDADLNNSIIVKLLTNSGIDINEKFVFHLYIYYLNSERFDKKELKKIYKKIKTIKEYYLRDCEENYELYLMDIFFRFYSFSCGESLFIELDNIKHKIDIKRINKIFYTEQIGIKVYKIDNEVFIYFPEPDEMIMESTLTTLMSGNDRIGLIPLIKIFLDEGMPDGIHPNIYINTFKRMESSQFAQRILKKYGKDNCESLKEYFNNDILLKEYNKLIEDVKFRERDTLKV